MSVQIGVWPGPRKSVSEGAERMDISAPTETDYVLLLPFVLLPVSKENHLYSHC